MKLRYLLLFVMLIGGVSPGAQPLQRDWIRTFSIDPSKTNQASTILLAPDGNIIVAGTSENEEHDLDFLIIKYSPGGGTVWKAKFDSGGGVHDVLRTAALDPAGNVIATGNSATVKFSPDGQKRWDTAYGGRSIATTADFVYVTGYLAEGFSTVQLTNGQSATGVGWTRTYNDDFKPLSQVVSIGVDGSVYVAGAQKYPCSRVPCHYESVLARYDVSGTRLWLTNVSGIGIGALVNAIQVTAGSDGAIYLFREYDGGNVVKLNSNGETLWMSQASRPGRMILDDSGSVITAGYGQGEAATVKLRPDGTLFWAKNYRVNEEAFGNGGAVDARNNIYVCGNTQPFFNEADFLFLKYSADGELLGDDKYDSPQNGNDIAVGIVVDAAGNAYFCGYSTTAAGGTEFVTIKYSAAPKIEQKPNGAMRLEFYASPGQQYAIEATADFFNWQALITNTADVSGLIQFDDTNASVIPVRFYRGKSAQ